jgi:hypothetical protein
MVKLEMIHQEIIDYHQLQLIIQVFYMEKIFYKFLLVCIILVLLQKIQIHIVGDKMSTLKKKK